MDTMFSYGVSRQFILYFTSTWVESINNLLYKETYHLCTEFTNPGIDSQIWICKHEQIPHKAEASTFLNVTVPMRSLNPPQWKRIADLLFCLPTFFKSYVILSITRDQIISRL